MTKVDCSLEQGVCYRYRHGHQRETLTSIVAGDACLPVGETFEIGGNVFFMSLFTYLYVATK